MISYNFDHEYIIFDLILYWTHRFQKNTVLFGLVLQGI